MSLKISRILHAGYVFECEQTQIAFDPIFENPFSRNCHAFPDVRFDLEAIKNLKFTAVFISHFHDDHCSLESLNHLDRKTPIYIYCVFEEILFLLKELGFTNVHSLQLGSPVIVGPFEVTPHRALDVDIDSIFQIKAMGLNILNVVDSWIDPDTLENLVRKAPWDLVLWPFQTMREIEVLSPSRAKPAPHELPPEWIEQLQKLNPRCVVPSSCQFVQESWSWYNHALFPISYGQFQKEMAVALPQAQVVRLNPSVSITLDHHSLTEVPSLSWIEPVGEQNVDYDYQENIKPPSTAEIARHFSALRPEQVQRVYDYCREGLIVKYRSMDPPQDPYFKKPRLWRLSIYDHLGSEQNFYYWLHQERIEPASAHDGAPAWTTEIPIAKIYAGLELGESLTSMYLRINDILFSPEIEKEIQSVDIVEDPLIRCLFSGSIGSYQAAQLKRLRAGE